MDKSHWVVIAVDDDPKACQFIAEAVEIAGFGLILCETYAEGLATINRERFRIVMVISDYLLGDQTGLDLRAQMMPDGADIPFVIYTGCGTKKTALKGIDLKVSGFIDKSNPMGLVSLIKKEAGARLQHFQELEMLRESFLSESEEILADVEPLILKLEQQPSDFETINSIFRLIHTIKGASGVLERKDFTAFLHQFEDVLTQLKAGSIKASPQLISLLLRACDAVQQLMEQIAKSGPQTLDLSPFETLFSECRKANLNEVQTAGTGKVSDPSSAASCRRSAEADEKIVVPTSMLDRFMHYSGEITVIRNMVNKIVATIEHQHPRVPEIQMLSELLEEMHKINSSMQGHIVELRKIPLSNVYRSLPRLVRDVANQLKKKVRLSTTGEMIRIDAKLGHVLSNCIIHMLRNAIDHGLETPEQRLAVGKPAEGLITIDCHEENEHIVMSIKDDGKGIDVEQIRAQAQAKGLYPVNELATMADQQVLRCIFHPGFSTARNVSDISGRGVGMDMVEASVASAKGEVVIHTQLGQGTKFIITLPIPKSVQIIPSLIIKSAEQLFAIPQEKVQRLVQLGTEREIRQLRQLESTRVLEVEGLVVPIINLAQVLRMPSPSASSPLALSFVLLRTEHQIFALEVDAIIDGEEIVVKPLAGVVKAIRAYSGATFFGDGSVGLSLDPEALSSLAGSEECRANNALQKQAPQPEQVFDKVQQFLTFRLSCKGRFAVPLAQIFRIEVLDSSSLQKTEATTTFIYRQQVVPIIDFRTALGLDGIDECGDPGSNVVLLLCEFARRLVAFAILEVLDIVESSEAIHPEIADRIGICGSMTNNDTVFSIADLQILCQRSLGKEYVLSESADNCVPRRCQRHAV